MSNKKKINYLINQINYFIYAISYIRMSLISEFKINIIIMNIVPFMKRKKKYDFDFNLMIINKFFLFYSQHTTLTKKNIYLNIILCYF